MGWFKGKKWQEPPTFQGKNHGFSWLKWSVCGLKWSLSRCEEWIEVEMRVHESMGSFKGTPTEIHRFSHEEHGVFQSIETSIVFPEKKII